MSACRLPCLEDDGQPLCDVCAAIDAADDTEQCEALPDGHHCQARATHEANAAEVGGRVVACAACAARHDYLTWRPLADDAPPSTEPAPAGLEERAAKACEEMRGLPPCSAPGCEGRCSSCFRVVDDNDPARAAYEAALAEREAIAAVHAALPEGETCTDEEAREFLVGSGAKLGEEVPPW